MILLFQWPVYSVMLRKTRQPTSNITNLKNACDGRALAEKAEELSEYFATSATLNSVFQHADVLKSSRKTPNISRTLSHKLAMIKNVALSFCIKSLHMNRMMMELYIHRMRLNVSFTGLQMNKSKIAYETNHA